MYYQRTFHLILDAINENFLYLFIENEINLIQTLSSGLSDDAQKLFIRLYSRRHTWLNKSKLAYEEIKNINQAVDELLQNSILENCDMESSELLQFLSVKDLQELMHSTGIVSSKDKSGLKQSLINIILSHCNITKPRQSRLSFSPSTNSPSPVLRPICLKTSLNDLCKQFVRISANVIVLMERIILLFFLNNQYQENTFASALLVDLGRRSFPPYQLSKDRHVFPSRRYLLAYEEALKLENDVSDFITSLSLVRRKQPQVVADSSSEDAADTNASQVAISSIAHLDKIMNNIFDQWMTSLCKLATADTDLRELTKFEHPSYFLRRYTADWVYTRLLGYYVEFLEAQARHKEACTILESLLAQSQYRMGSRGKWWLRLILNSQTHCKLEKEKVCVLLENALMDPFVKLGIRYNLERRLNLLTDANAKKSKKRIENKLVVIDNIVGDYLHAGIPGKKSVFMNSFGEASSVEQFAIEFYESKGWKCMHSENSFFSFLFTLLFWDILFELEPSPPCVFLTPFQTAPLDLFSSDAFYFERKICLDERLKQINSIDFVIETVSKYYNKYFGVQAVGVNWELISLTDLLEIINCFEGKMLALILRKMCEDYRGSSKGFPDLLLWNPTGKALLFDADSSNESLENTLNLDPRRVMFVEVKGPNDHLSDDQRCWMDLLSELGEVSVRVCRVKLQKS